MAQRLPEHDINTGECDLLALGEDIEDLVEYISPPQRQLVVEALVRRLQYVVDDIWNTRDELAITQHPVKLQLYGSSSTGLDLPTSDIDLTLVNVIAAEKQLNATHELAAVRALWSDTSAPQPAAEAWDDGASADSAQDSENSEASEASAHEASEEGDTSPSSAPVSPSSAPVSPAVQYERQLAVLRPIEREMRARGWECQLIRARVPIVKLVDRDFGFHFDISVEQCDGVASGALITRALASNALLVPIIKLLKLVLHYHGLHRPYTGGVGSYLLVLLVLHYFEVRGDRTAPYSPLQLHPHVIEGPGRESGSASPGRESDGPGSEHVTTQLARALLGVLQWYGETLAPRSWTLRPGELELRPEEHVTQSVLAPLTGHDVAASATALPQVFALWAQLARDLRAGVALAEIVRCRSVVATYIDKLTRVNNVLGQKRERDNSAESDHVTKRQKSDDTSNNTI